MRAFAERLADCARRDPSAWVRRGCRERALGMLRAPALPPAPLRIRVVPLRGAHAAGAAYGVVFSDGLVRYGVADAAGRLLEPEPRAGSVQITVPAPILQGGRHPGSEGR